MGTGTMAVARALRDATAAGARDGEDGGSRHPYPWTVPAATASPHVLVVEDEPLLRQLLEQLLTFEGFRVVTAESAIGGVSLIRRLQPAAIVLDLGLPYVSGLRLLSDVRADPDPAVRAVPVVILSALTETIPPDRRDQVSAVLGKPVRLKALAAAVRQAVRGA
jgi:DNA-binding response OmpR family regulator